jgi:hypothetical protein
MKGTGFCPALCKMLRKNAESWKEDHLLRRQRARALERTRQTAGNHLKHSERCNNDGFASVPSIPANHSPSSAIPSQFLKDLSTQRLSRDTNMSLTMYTCWPNLCHHSAEGSRVVVSTAGSSTWCPAGWLHQRSRRWRLWESSLRPWWKVRLGVKGTVCRGGSCHRCKGDRISKIIGGIIRTIALVVYLRGVIQLSISFSPLTNNNNEGATTIEVTRSKQAIALKPPGPSQ